MLKFKTLIFTAAILHTFNAYADQVAITMDDPSLTATPLLSPGERDSKIRNALKDAKLKAALFVCGKRVDSPDGRALLKSWDQDGHILANHSYSHEDFNSSKMTFGIFSADFKQGERIIYKLIHFHKFFRFPFLKEGDNAEKRDQMRRLLKDEGYLNGAVTIDASDWYVNDRMIARLEKNPNADLKPYRDYYLDHIWNRSLYYDDLAHKLTGRHIKHTLLIHHSLLNALFLGDLVKMFRSRNWKVIDAAESFKDPVFSTLPNVVPAGESLIWGIAKESGKFEDKLRYPGEDGEYEKDAMDKAGL